MVKLLITMHVTLNTINGVKVSFVPKTYLVANFEVIDDRVMQDGQLIKLSAP